LDTRQAAVAAALGLLTIEIETVLDAGPLRGADTWHLACAL
jgi:hypothetical protein